MFQDTNISFQKSLCTLLLLYIPQYGPNLNNNSIDVANSLAHGLAGEAISLLIQVHFKDLIYFSRSGIFRPPSILFWHIVVHIIFSGFPRGIFCKLTSKSIPSKVNRFVPQFKELALQSFSLEYFFFSNPYHFCFRHVHFQTR